MTSDQPPTVPPGWYPDPHGVAELRWWDGSTWTENIHDSEAPAPATQEYRPPGQIQDDSGTAIFDLDFVPEESATNQQPESFFTDAAAAEPESASDDDASPMHNLFSIDPEPVSEPTTTHTPVADVQHATPEPEPHQESVQAEVIEIHPPAAMPAEPVAAAPVAADPVAVDPVVAEPAIAEPVIAPVAAEPIVAPITAEPATAPVQPADEAPHAAAQADPDRLPSRRELRMREQAAAVRESESAPEQPEVVAAPIVEEPQTSAASQPMESQPAPSEATPDQQWPSPQMPTPADQEQSSLAQSSPEQTSLTQSSTAQPNPPQPAPAAFDTSVPTSFNWAADAPATPSVPEPDGFSADTAAPPAAPAEPLQFAQETSPVQPAFHNPSPADVEPAEVSLDPDVTDLSAFPPPAMPVAADQSAFGGVEFANPAQNDAAPAASTDAAWGQAGDSFDELDPAGPLPALQSSTMSSWIIASMPLIAGILSVGAVKGAENYPRYAPADASWWMLVAGLLGVLYLVTLLLAIADRRKLDSWGHSAPAHWLWALATAPAYLIARTLAIRAETGRMTSQLWVWIVLGLIVVGAYVAMAFLPPELVSAYTLPFL